MKKTIVIILLFCTPYLIGSDVIWEASKWTLRATNTLDWYSSIRALDIPGTYESNVLFRPLYKNDTLALVTKIIAGELIIWGMSRVRRQNRWLPIVCNFALSAFLGYCAYSNARIK